MGVAAFRPSGFRLFSRKIAPSSHSSRSVSGHSRGHALVQAATAVQNRVKFTLLGVQNFVFFTGRMLYLCVTPPFYWRDLYEQLISGFVPRAAEQAVPDRAG